MAARRTVRTAVVGLGLIVAGTSIADDGVTAWPGDPWVRLDLGVDVGAQVGGKVVLAAEPARWASGGLALGLAVSGHAHAWRDPAPGATTPPKLTGHDADVRAAVYLGHTFRFADRRVGIGLQAYTGVVARLTDTRLVDPTHDLDLRQQHTAVFSETGVRLEVPMRLGDHVGLTVDATVPLLVVGQPGLPLSWSVAGPTVGLSLSIYL